MRTLDSTDKQLLSRLEAAVDRGLAGTHEAVHSLLEIQRRQLYLATHDDFWEYVKARWPDSERHIYRLLARERVAEVVCTPDPMGQTPPQPNERQARELNRLPAEDQQPVWAAVVTLAKATKKRVTAKAVAEAVDQCLAAETDTEAVAEATEERHRRASAEVDREVIESWQGTVRRANRRLSRRLGERVAEALDLMGQAAGLVAALAE